MPENYICKDCNYASDKAGFCPYCDMPLEPLDPSKIDPETGTPKQDPYKEDDLQVEDPDDLPPLPRKNEEDEEDLEKEDEEEITEEEPVE